MSSQDALNLLRTQSLTMVVQNELEQRIIDGILQPGMPLREASIANELGISRGPVREAFRMLEERGLVLFEKNCGVRVRELALEQARQIYQIRVPLEALIAELATQSLTDSGRARLGSILEEMTAAVQRHDISSYTELNFRFHDLLAQLTGNQALYETYRRLVVQLKLLRSHSFRQLPHNLEVSLDEHRSIVQAVLNGDSKQAAALLSGHASVSLSRVQQAISEAL
jgi:DNA-binding GntR family transcriptional regulator